MTKVKAYWNDPGFSSAMDDFFWKPWLYGVNTKSVQISTKVEESKGVIKFALPGVDKEDLEVKYEKDVLTVSLTKGNEFINAFSEQYLLEDYDFKTLKSSLVNGVLTLELSKKDEAKPVIVKLE